VQPYRIDAADRAWFKRCRRAWDLGALARRAYEPASAVAVPGSGAFAMGVADALAVYYFPGMWTWDRSVVMPIVHQALDRAVGHRRDVDLASGHRLLDRYAAWAPTEDRFLPVRVAADVEVNVPDPLLSDREIATEDGAPVTFATRIDVVVFDEADNVPRLMGHLIGPGPFSDPEYLMLEEGGLTTCWAWAQSTLDRRVAGFLVNEIRFDESEPFRRTAVAVTPTELDLAGRALGREVLDMLDPGLETYANPTPDGCAWCAFRSVCRSMREGRDPTAELRSAFRRRSAPEIVEGRLGGQSWSVNRGARPPRW
jgi:hypothetical protein